MRIESSHPSFKEKSSVSLGIALVCTLVAAAAICGLAAWNAHYEEAFLSPTLDFQEIIFLTNLDQAVVVGTVCALVVAIAPLFLFFPICCSTK